MCLSGASVYYSTHSLLFLWASTIKIQLGWYYNHNRWNVNMYNLTCLMWPFKGRLKYSRIRLVVATYRCIWYEIHYKGNLKLRSQNTSYCLIEVVTEAGLTVAEKLLTFWHLATFTSYLKNCNTCRYMIGSYPSGEPEFTSRF